MRDLIKQILREETSDMKDIIFNIINDSVEGVDVYESKGGLWLIFTDEKEWVIELTKEGILWYNHVFFQDIFKYISMDVIKNQHYITDWVEDTIKNGVKETNPIWARVGISVEDTIKNGVKDTIMVSWPNPTRVEDTVKKGIKLNKS